MGAKELLHELTEYLKSKYAVTGITVAGQVDGCLSSAVSIAINGKEAKSFKIILTETEKKFK